MNPQSIVSCNSELTPTVNFLGRRSSLRVQKLAARKAEETKKVPVAAPKRKLKENANVPEVSAKRKVSSTTRSAKSKIVPLKKRALPNVGGFAAPGMAGSLQMKNVTAGRIPALIQAESISANPQRSHVVASQNASVFSSFDISDHVVSSSSTRPKRRSSTFTFAQPSKTTSVSITKQISNESNDSARTRTSLTKISINFKTVTTFPDDGTVFHTDEAEEYSPETTTEIPKSAKNRHVVAECKRLLKEHEEEHTLFLAVY
ncbi:hypothetical protein GYMLUDRAFT_600504 [Collybiopsis luxurians FD-317 M1]|uniref:Uncharacterized protein n=1 Tax=Collybiopsis luxurians FD-317 M1 TaxID=944289 RepID=A0A0D0BAJ3_9AGAR|nr:hypothetical protein GYMLUDRAFT_600504 [Collybiopsis luxurians FD-317 M1]